MTNEVANQDRISRLAEQVSVSGHFAREQSASLDKWVLASCLSANGGAIVTLLNIGEGIIDPRSHYWAIAWFLLGMVLAIVFGIIISAIMRKYSGIYRRASGVFHDYLSSGDHGEFDRLETSTLNRLGKISNVVFYVQGASLFSFIVGIVIAVEGIK